MKLREKIILFVALLIGVYGLTDYFVLSGRADKGVDRSEKASQDLELFATTAMANLSVAKATDMEHLRHLASKAEGEWKRDPFKVMAAPEIEEEEAVAGEDGLELVYSGYIRAGRRILAVVNGMEYKIGEKIAELGYKVSKITTSQVVLLTEANKEIVLYLEEN